MTDQSTNDDDHSDAEEGYEPVTFVELGLRVVLGQVGLVGGVHRQEDDHRRCHNEGAEPTEVPAIRFISVDRFLVVIIIIYPYTE